MQVIANLSMLFTELPPLERIAAARQAGFTGVEIQFPYAIPAQQLQEELQRQQMPLHMFNLPAGDLMSGGTGLACQPRLRREYAEALDTALEYALVLKPKMVNVLAGRLLDGQSFDEAFSVLAANLRDTTRAFSRLHVRVLCEAVNPLDMPGFLINTPEHLLLLLKEVGGSNLFTQLDLYHMARQQLDILLAIEQLGKTIGHVQFADCPGRHEPGSGDIEFLAVRQKLQQVGYDGVWAAEYHPRAATVNSLGWLHERAFLQGR